MKTTSKKPSAPAAETRSVDRLLDKWDEIHADWAANVTRIYGRQNFHRIWDVVAHSALSFKFQGNLVTRGYVEAIIAGDTKCGKSEVAEKMTAFLNLSKPIVCETASLAGVVGGVKEVGGKWSISWGALPRLDRRLAVLDEVTGLTTEQISSMSGLRSSGVAQLVKIEAEKARARVRKLWISNPRTDRNKRVSTYPYGVMVLPEIIGRAEDISRFDCALVASSEEVPLELLNAKTRAKEKHVYTAEAAKALLGWVWSRTADQVAWAPGTEDAVVDLALAQSRFYSSHIPLVEPGEQRFRVARVSVALAARFHSTDSGGDKIVVRPEHVALAGRFLSGCFDGPVTGYKAYSEAKRQQDAVFSEKELNEMLAVLERYANLDVAMDAIAMADDLTRISVIENNKQAAMFADLARMGLLEHGNGNLFKTKKYSEFYRQARSRVTGAAVEKF